MADMRMKCDYHTHTVFSDGRDTLESMLQGAQEAGLAVMAVTDHFDPNDPKPAIASLREEDLAAHFAHIRSLRETGSVRLLCGIETQPDGRGALPIRGALLRQCDVIVTSCHYLAYEGPLQPGQVMSDAYWDCFRETVLAIAEAPGDILGHCEEYLPIRPLLQGVQTTFAQRRAICREVADRYLHRGYVDALAQRLRARGKACELHCATMSPRPWVIERLAAQGVVFSPGSDAHERACAGQVDFAYRMAEQFGLTLWRHEGAMNHGD